MLSTEYEHTKMHALLKPHLSPNSPAERQHQSDATRHQEPSVPGTLPVVVCVVTARAKRNIPVARRSSSILRRMKRGTAHQDEERRSKMCDEVGGWDSRRP